MFHGYQDTYSYTRFSPDIVNYMQWLHFSDFKSSRTVYIVQKNLLRNVKQCGESGGKAKRQRVLQME